MLQGHGSAHGPARPAGAPVTMVHAPAPLPRLSASSPRVQEGRWSEALAAIPLLTCTPDTPFGEALRQLVGHKKHRWAAALPAPLSGAFSGTNRVQLVSRPPCWRLGLIPGLVLWKLAVWCLRLSITQASEHELQTPANQSPAALLSLGLAGFTLWMERGRQLA